MYFQASQNSPRRVAIPVLVKDGKPCSSGNGGLHDGSATNGGQDHEVGMPSLLDVAGGLSGHHAGAGHHHHLHHGMHGVKPEYSLGGEVDVCGSAAEMHAAAAAAAGLGTASGAQLPTLMHMGYGAPHHRHMLTSNHQDHSGMGSYLQHRTAW
jgi:hypothetical protein